jgi:hypothetical protein
MSLHSRTHIYTFDILPHKLENVLMILDARQGIEISLTKKTNRFNPIASPKKNPKEYSSIHWGSESMDHPARHSYDPIIILVSS